MKKINLSNLISLNKDQLQKVILSTLGFVGLIYIYFSFFLGPLSRSRDSMLATIADLQGKVAQSKNQIMKANNLEHQASAATARFAELKAFSPEGAPIAWFPPRMKAFFAARQVDKASARLEATEAFKQPELAGWMKYHWQLELPKGDFEPLGKAIADLENKEPLLSIVRLKIHSTPDDPQNQVVDLDVTTALAQR